LHEYGVALAPYIKANEEMWTSKKLGKSVHIKGGRLSYIISLRCIIKSSTFFRPSDLTHSKPCFFIARSMIFFGGMEAGYMVS